MTRRIYVASSCRNERQENVVNVLRLAGHQVYDFKNPLYNTGFSWNLIDPDWKKWNLHDYRTVLQANSTVARGFLSDKRGMEWADTCVLVTPCGRSAHLELGYMAGQNKRAVILLNEGDEPELMNLLATDICVNIQEVLAVLK